MKKKIINILVVVFLSAGFTSCNDSFLDRKPTTDINEPQYWKTRNDLELFANGIYNKAANNNDYDFMLGHTHDAWASNTHAAFWWDVMSDNFVSRSSNHAWAAQYSAGQNTIPANAGRGTWKWELLFHCNSLIQFGPTVEAVSEDIINYYTGEAYFFRAWFYLDKVQKYGDVPWISTPLNTESEELYKPRDKREVVMDSVLNDITRAASYLPVVWDDNRQGRIDKGTALALKSRICLYEGTYRKYHNLQGGDKFLEECVKASEELMALNKYEIHMTGNPSQDYASLFTSDDLAGNKEVILYRKYTTGILGHRLCGYIVQNGVGATKDFIDDFLCIEDGKALPLRATKRYQNNEYEPLGGYRLENVFRDRDPRLTQIVLDPGNSQGILFNRDQFEFPRIAGMTGWQSATGYHVIKYYEKSQDAKGYGNESHDAPLFRYAEVLLNLAEATAELGTCTQEILDKTINKLRERVDMPKLNINDIPIDSKYASEGLSPLLVEIRRERRVELCFEQHRYQDLMRWKKGSYLKNQMLGMRFEESYIDEYYEYFGTGLEGEEKEKEISNIKATLFLRPLNGVNYLDAYGGTNFTNRNFDETKNYLWPIPSGEIARNPELGQNPEW
ncbi:MAG: RagB/SusD family nutrient uptake outer membrane protein [Bacteroides sp.]|nr:RagB/SusD family nutrient uptake outer membrane protein [Bacteroides sp.]